MYKRKLHKEISSGLLALIVAFSLTGCGSSRDALEISDTESAQAEEVGQETATATSQTIPETTTEPETEKLTYQTGLYQEKPWRIRSRWMLPGSCRKESMVCCHTPMMRQSVSGATVQKTVW